MGPIAFKETIKESGGDANTDQVRSDFREVWIWETYMNGENENFSLSSVIPDTITRCLNEH